MSRAYEVKDDPSGKTIPAVRRSALLHRGECDRCGYAPWDADGHELDAPCKVPEVCPTCGEVGPVGPCHDVAGKRHGGAGYQGGTNGR